jgi:hypothetical protein
MHDRFEPFKGLLVSRDVFSQCSAVYAAIDDASGIFAVSVFPMPMEPVRPTR